MVASIIRIVVYAAKKHFLAMPFAWKVHHLSGSVGLTQLPDKFEFLYLTSNQISGSLDLTSLPPSMCRSHDCQSKIARGDEGDKCLPNQLSGYVVLTQLPSKLKFLYISFNQFSPRIKFAWRMFKISSADR